MKKHFLIIDTETTQDGKVADFGAVVCDKAGNVVASCGVLIREFFLDREAHPLFYTKDADPLWGAANLPKRYANYDAMLAGGTRMLASVAAVNGWLYKAEQQFRPVMTAYNLAFDADKMMKSGIDCGIFDHSFCLWHAAYTRYARSKAYLQFCLDNHYFNPPTKAGNMTIKTDAETMARFIHGDAKMADEPHTALEDALFYEKPILERVIKGAKVSDYMNPQPYNWREVQLRDHYKPC